MALVYSRGLIEGDAAKAKAIQPCKFHPLHLYLPYFTRFDPIKDVELQVPGRFSAQ